MTLRPGALRASARPLAACAAAIFVWVSTEAVAQLPGACGEAEVERAMLNFEMGMNRRQDVTQLLNQEDAAVVAAMRQCRKGSTIAVLPRHASDYCDMNKSTMQVPYKIICVKR